MPEFFSQYGEDRWITEHLDPPDGGVFVDVGAYDGVTDSNTFHFEKLGWTGLCIEANPDMWPQLARRRACKIGRYAIGGDPERPFDVNWIPLLSGFGRGTASGGRQVKVPVKRLDEALSESGIERIDLLSIDDEGAELEVWTTLDHQRYKPGIVIIEYNTVGLPNHEERIMDAFYPPPYRMVHRSFANLIFERWAGGRADGG